MSVLLDTHVWIWLVTDAPKGLGPKTRRQLSRAIWPDAPSVSTVSAFEIAALHVAGRVKFTQPVERWIHDSISAAAFRVLDLNTDIALDAGLIPASSLADPIDRCLVATARDHQIPLVTRDRQILTYAKSSGLVRVIDASA